MKAVLSTKGLEETLERLAQMGKDMDAAVARALPIGGQVLVDGMRRRAPEKTGDLKRHIGMTPVIRAGNFSFVIVGLYPGEPLPKPPQPKRNKPNPKKAFSKRDRVYYGIYQEFGRPGMKDGHPFIRPTLKADMGKARKAMLERLKSEMS
jgi:HK97 gp10 family phage protein